MVGHPILERNYSPDRVRRQYRSVAWFYDAWGKLTETKAVDRLLQQADVTDGSRVLEVAVGTGRLFANIAALNPSGHLDGVDLSTEMLERARRRMDNSGTHTPYRLQEADAYKLPFNDASFDYLFNTYMLDLLPADDFPRLLQEFSRVLRPGGKLALANFSPGTKNVHNLWYWLARLVPALLTDCRPVLSQAAVRNAGFEILFEQEMSQNTFPSAIMVAQNGSEKSVQPDYRDV